MHSLLVLWPYSNQPFLLVYSPKNVLEESVYVRTYTVMTQPIIVNDQSYCRNSQTFKRLKIVVTLHEYSYILGTLNALRATCMVSEAIAGLLI